jgi:FkbM family methyltransferase
MSSAPAPDLSRLPEEIRGRVLLTTSCRDCDVLPKVEAAGQVITREDGREVQVMHNGVVVEAGGYFGDWMAEIIRSLRGHHEPQEELAFARILDHLAGADRPLSAIELGSFWAYYSLWFLHEFPDGRVVAMEPDPLNLELGKRNFALNGRTGTFVQGVIGPRPGEPTDFVSETDGQTHSVAQMSLETLMAAGDLDHVDLLLCDIQGGEQYFFTQAMDLLRRGVARFAVVSTHHHSISGDALTHQKLLDLFRDMGAHIVVEHTVGESFSGDGLIVVSFDPAMDGDFVLETSLSRQSDSIFGALEYDLAHAQEQVRAVSAERGHLERVAREAQEQARNLADELSRVHATRLWRSSQGLRRIYSRLRAARGRDQAG